MGRIEDKVCEIERFLEELESSLPTDLNEYKHNYKIRAICERYFEKIVEALVDTAFLMIKENDFQIPEEDKKAFDILATEKVISENLSEKLKEAKGMRNIIVHEYGEIDDEVVFEAVTEEIIKDAKEFIKCVENLKL